MEKSRVKGRTRVASMPVAASSRSRSGSGVINFGASCGRAARSFQDARPLAHAPDDLLMPAMDAVEVADGRDGARHARREIGNFPVDTHRL
jgi:hypothetical protein